MRPPSRLRAVALWIPCLLAPACGETAAVIPGDPAHGYAQDDPSLAARADRGVWLARRAWDGAGDRVELLPLGEEPVEPTVLHRSPTRVLGTALATDGTDALHCVWAEQSPTGWVLREVVVPPGGSPDAHGPPAPSRTVAEVPGANLVDPVLAADPDGALLLVWVEIDGPAMRLMGSAHQGGAWGPPAPIAHDERSCWSPAATASGPGAFAVAWDGAVDGDYDVHLARVAVRPDGTLDVAARHRVTDTPRFEAHPSVASDGQRVYVAYDVAPEGWGREGSTNRLEVSLHSERSIEVVAVERDLVAPLAVAPMEELSLALQGNVERPCLVVEGSGQLVLLFRGMPLTPEWDDPEDPGFQARAEASAGGKGYRTSVWYTFCTRFDGQRWQLDGKHKQVLLDSEGRNDAPIAATRLRGGGVAFATVGDGREPLGDARPAPGQRTPTWWAPVTDRPTLVVTALQRKGGDVGPLPLGEARPLPAPRAPVPPPQRPQRRLADGRTATLALGDLHRHTDLSRCSSNWDGSLTDAFRYAFDVAELQYLAVTDHFEHMTRYDLWRTRSYVDAYHAPGRMVNLRAYERADARSGHRNVISGGGELPVVAYPSTFEAARDDAIARLPHELFSHLETERQLTIPHTPAGMMAGSAAVLDWRTFDPRFDRLVEVFQGYRGSSEAAGAPRAIEGLPAPLHVRPNLDRGLHFGLIASSDHQSTGGAFAGAWVTELDRPGVFEALFARRTFGSTVPMALWAEWDGVPMGMARRVPGGRDAQLVVEADGWGHALESIVLVVDGVEREPRALSGTVAREVFDLPIPAAGDSYVYARVHLAGGELAWTSPVRLGAETAEPDGITGREAWGPDAEPGS